MYHGRLEWAALSLGERLDWAALSLGERLVTRRIVVPERLVTRRIVVPERLKQGRYYPPWYQATYTPWYTPSFHSVYTPPSSLPRTSVLFFTLIRGAGCRSFTPLVLRLTRRGLPGPESTLLPSGINPSPRRNLSIKLKKPATESHSVQGHPE